MSHENRNHPQVLPEEGKLLNVNEFLASIALHDAPQPPAVVTGSIADRPPITSPAQHADYKEYRHGQETAARLRGERSPFAP